MTIGIVGAGASGAHAVATAAQLGLGPIEIIETNIDRAAHIASQHAEVRVVPSLNAHQWDAAILSLPVGGHAAIAEQLLRRGTHVVSITDDLEEVDALLDLHSVAVEHERALVVGAGFAPGFTCLLARHAGDALDEVVEIAVAKAGTGGPACARQHHRAMKRHAYDWMDGDWAVRRGGSGRDLAWFPDPIGARDSYRAALPSPRLLQRVYPEAERISARVSANRRDRFTSPFPMLRPPHADGGPGAVRVEVRGRRRGAFETLIYGVMTDPSRAAGSVSCATVAELMASATSPPPSGAWGLSEWDQGPRVLHRLHELGLRVVTFEGLGAE